MTLTLEDNKDWIATRVKDAAGGAPAPVWLNAHLPAPDGRNEAVLFIKPELTGLPATYLPNILKLFDGVMKSFNAEPVNIGVLGWRYMADHNIAGDHYGVINRISREGTAALSEMIRAKVRSTFHVPETNILGAHQFLAKFPEWNASTLSTLWENLNATHTQKLAPGTYAQEIQYQGQPWVIFGGFHPQQLEQFTAPGRSIVVVPIRSHTPYRQLREGMTGDLDPVTSPPTSLRGALYQQRERLGIAEILKGLGVHVSAGPLEGMTELARFLSDRAVGRTLPYEQTNMGAAWLRAGGTTEDYPLLANNMLIDISGRSISAFDATELMDMNEAVNLLRRAGHKS